MELIEKPKSRIQTFKKRKEGLMKKLHQLTTLCDIDACMIIYEPTQQHSSIWPDPEQEPGQIRRLIDVYKSKSKDLSSIKSYGLSDFFVERKRKVEEELLKLRKTNSEAKYPTWNDSFNFMNETELKGFASQLHARAQSVRSRIQIIKMREKQGLEMMKNMMLLNSTASASASASASAPQFYNLDHQFINPAAIDMHIHPINMVAPQNYYAVAPPLPPQPYPYMLWPPNNMNTNTNMTYSSMDQNQNYWGDDGDGDDITRYLLQFNP
ncbi:hypothetical protein C2S53_003729 [Perilla frutescens var. hirtella]|uniref:MADS-box domain-containing protein n=1 Tax=Perilla frutescens var. hirtella TaxID=608512 RepID=A0AAD4P5A9_PERFH|nr:hypothetical protein C2S53_003729 [Perilla frutescens var. hirtella]